MTIKKIPSLTLMAKRVAVLSFLTCLFFTGPLLVMDSDNIEVKSSSSVTGHVPAPPTGAGMDGSQHFKNNGYFSVEPSLQLSDSVDCYVLVCGISDYPGDQHDLDYCDDDAKDIVDLMKTRYEIPSNNIMTLIDSNMTTANFNSRINALSARMDENDYLFLYYSGHGDANTRSVDRSWSCESPHPYPNYMDEYWDYYYPGAYSIRVHFTEIDLEPGYDVIYVGDYYERYDYYINAYSDSHVDVWSDWIYSDRIYVNLYSDYSVTNWGFAIDKVEVLLWCEPYEIIPYDRLNTGNGLTDADLDLILSPVPGRVFFVLDSCNSGGVIENIQDDNRYLVSACKGYEYSLEDSYNQNGLFTYQYIKAINESRDLDHDGLTSFQEIFKVARERTLDRSTYLGYTQSPQEFNSSFGPFTFDNSVELIDASIINDTHVLVDYQIQGLGLNLIDFAIYDFNSEQYYRESANPSLDSIDPGHREFNITGGNLSFKSMLAVVLHHVNYTGSQADAIIIPIKENETDTGNGDSDSDGITDGDEIQLGLNPWSPDTDGDAISDSVEIDFNFDPLFDDSGFDYDSDEIPNIYEIQFGLDPHVSNQGIDSDQDGLSDVEEFIVGTNPCSNDTDADGLRDPVEIEIGTDPCRPDTDGDGFSDYIEVKYFNDPKNAGDSPAMHFLSFLMMACSLVGISAIGVIISKFKKPVP
ncbi:MAG: caspase family protein, partial [Promethearchaeota archaeon]